MYNLIGQKFGRLIVIKKVPRSENRVKHGGVNWFCQCDCGKTTITSTANLTDGGTRSCGCLAEETWERISHRKERGKPEGVAARNHFYRNYKNSASSRGLAFELSIEQALALAQLPCHYCGVEPSILENSTASSFGPHGRFCGNGIDRKDSNEGYILSNCVPCCTTCNRAKRSTGYNEFMAWIERVRVLAQSKAISKTLGFIT